MSKKIKSTEAEATTTLVDQHGTTAVIPTKNPKKSMAQIVKEHNTPVVEAKPEATTNPTRKIKKPESKPEVKGPTKKELDAKIAKAAAKREKSTGTSLKDLAAEFKIAGRVARRALRAAAKSGKLKHDHGHGWTFEGETLKLVREMLQDLSSGKKTVTRVAKQAKTEATPPKNPIRKLKKSETTPEVKAQEPVAPLTKQERNRVGKAIAEAIKSYAEANGLGSDDSADWESNVQDEAIGEITEKLETLSVVAKDEVARFRLQPAKFQADLVAQLVAG